MPRPVEIGDSYAALLPGQSLERVPFVLAEGPRGTSKTRSILTVLMLRLQKWPGSRLIIARSTRTRLTDSVLPTLEEQVFPAVGLPVPGGAGPENRHSYQLPNGSSIVLMGLDDPQRGQSVEACWVYASEVVEITSLDQVMALAGTLRQVVPPCTRTGDEVCRQLVADCNPGPPGHWANEVAEPVPASLRRVQAVDDYERVLAHNATPPPAGRWKRIVTRHQDNPAYWDPIAWDWTDLGRSYLATLQSFRGALRRRWLDGDWVAAEGVVFPEFDEDRHVIDAFAIPASWPQYVGIDPGFDHPCAVLWFAVGPAGTIYLCHEHYRGGWGVQQHAETIRAANVGRNVLKTFADPQEAWSRRMQQPRPIAQQFEDCGIRVQQWPRSTDKQAMVENVRKYLMDGKLKIFRPCAFSISELQSWQFKRNAKGEQLSGDDQYEDRNNHAIDVMCGVLAAGIDKGPGIRIADRFGEVDPAVTKREAAARFARLRMR